MSMPTTEERLTAIEKRNLRVEADKAWETSWTRRLSVMVLTYLVIASFMQVVIGTNGWLNALVPTSAFLLSTLGLGLVKDLWLRGRD